jgi:hypothetical protein|tara:strand:- start:2245 stop:2538 length:294 start_codon:yes stop_codon:yes gene_type:complete
MQIIKEELEEARLPAWERPGYVPEPGLGPHDEKSQKTNMNRSLREFAQWVAEVDGHIESLSGEYVSADEIPSDINLYDMWRSGMSPDQVAQDLMGGA